MLTENVSTDLEVPFMTILSLFTVVLLMNGALLPSTSKSESLWLTSKLALNFWSCTQHTSSDFQIPPAANVELSWQHNLCFYYPNPLSFFSKKSLFPYVFLAAFSLPQSNAGAGDMPTCNAKPRGCVLATALPAVQLASRAHRGRTLTVTLTQTPVAKQAPDFL